MICSERITLGKYLETYCMRDVGHSGKHSPHADPRPITPIKKEPISVRVAGTASAAD